MKRVTLILGLLLYVWSVAAQSAEQKIKSLEGISDIKSLPTTVFNEKYEVMLTQPIDWKNPEAGSFKQRIVVMHCGFDRPSMIITQGYGAGFALREGYREEISRLFDMNVIFVEHRYFDKSKPENLDWQYLTAENSAHDLHAIKSLFSTIYPSKWLASGISKGGTTTMLYATFYPEDVDIYVPYVGPVCTSREDSRFKSFFKDISTAENRQIIHNYQCELLKRKEKLMPLFEEHCNNKSLKFTLPLSDIYDYTVLEFAFTLWQWGLDVNTLPKAGDTDKAHIDFLLRTADPEYFALGGENAPFFVQASRELGYYPYDLKPFKGLIDLRSSKGYLEKIFVPEELHGVKFDKTLYKKMRNYLKNNDPKMMMVYGQTDPWTAPGAGWAVEGKQNMCLFVQPEGSHRARILTLPEEMKQQAIAQLEEWLGEKAREVE